MTSLPSKSSDPSLGLTGYLNHWKVLSRLWHCHLKKIITTLSCARSSQLWHGLNSIIHPQEEPTRTKNQIYPSIIRWSIRRLYLNLIQSSYCSFWKGLFCPREVPPYSWSCCLPFARWCCFECYLLLVRLHTARRWSHPLQSCRTLRRGQPRVWVHLGEAWTTPDCSVQSAGLPVQSEDPSYGWCEYNGNLIPCTAFLGTSDVCSALWKKRNRETMLRTVGNAAVVLDLPPPASF